MAAYLRYERQCPIVSFERGLYGCLENPDVLAVTKGRSLIEVEIKVSMADFRADAKKWKWKWEPLLKVWRQFYYAVPPDLVERVRPGVPEGRGLLTLTSLEYMGVRGVEVVVPARRPPPGEYKRLPLRDLITMVRNQSGTLCGLATEVARLVASGTGPDPGRGREAGPRAGPVRQVGEPIPRADATAAGTTGEEVRLA